MAVRHELDSAVSLTVLILAAKRIRLECESEELRPTGFKPLQPALLKLPRIILLNSLFWFKVVSHSAFI